MDPELAKMASSYLEGYEDLSEYMASDTELSLYKRFRSLSTRNILYLQAEVQVLEDELQRLDRLDQEDSQTFDRAGMDILQAARDWETFDRKARAGDSRQLKKMAVVKAIRIAVREYQEAVILQSQFAALKPPSKRVFTAMSSWFSTRRPLLGSDGAMLESRAELAALAEQTQPDRLSKLLYNRFGYMFKEKRNIPSSWGATYYYPEKTIGRFVDAISVVWSILLILGPIYFFYFVKNEQAVLGMLSAFVTAFGLSVGLFTNARRAEVFAAAAAYAAVLVVFVSGPLGGSTGPGG